MTHGTGLFLAAGSNLEGFGAFFTHGRKKLFSLPFPFLFYHQTSSVFSSIGPISHEYHKPSLASAGVNLALPVATSISWVEILMQDCTGVQPPGTGATGNDN